jgi:ABC-2 type transport system permease protein
VREAARQLRAVSALLKVSLATAMQYRSNFLTELVVGLLRDAGRAAPLALVYWHRDSVGGWELPHALLVMAFFLLLSAVQSGVFEPNLGEAVESVRTGTMDLLLMKPVDAQLLVSLRKFTPAALWDLLAAAAVGGLALHELPAPSPGDAALAAGLFASGVISMYGLWLLAICASFFFVRVDNLRFLLWAISDAGRWPIDVFSGAARFLLTAVVPVALITSFPAQALRGTWTGQTLGVAAAVSLAFAVGSRLAWRRSLANYTSASS